MADRDLIDELGGPVRFARLAHAAAMDTMLWEMDFEIFFGRKATEEELAEVREANAKQRMRPGVIWPGIDFF